MNIKAKWAAWLRSKRNLQKELDEIRQAYSAVLDYATTGGIQKPTTNVSRVISLIEAQQDELVEMMVAAEIRNRVDRLERVRALVANDQIATACQSIAQYRQTILKALCHE